MLVESTIMLNTMLTVVAKITPQHLTCGIPMATAHLGSDSDIELIAVTLGLPVLTWRQGSI